MRRNIEKGRVHQKVVYKQRTETKYFVCEECSKIWSSNRKPNQSFMRCRYCNENRQSLFIAPLITNTHRCEGCNNVWESSDLTSKYGWCKNCKRKNISYPKWMEELNFIVIRYASLINKKKYCKDFMRQDLNYECNLTKDEIYKKILNTIKE